jgi:hypothetical protein
VPKDPEPRRRGEQQLLDHYHSALLARGVAGYDRRPLSDDYRPSVLWQAATPVWQAANEIPALIWWHHSVTVSKARRPRLFQACLFGIALAPH